MNVPVEYDKTQNTLWIGGKILEIHVDSKGMYEDYYGSIITNDPTKLSTPDRTYKWGITNGSKLSMSYFGCYLKPGGKYKKFKTSIFMDENVKQSLTVEFRKDKYNGEVLKSIVLEPGKTTDINVDIGGIQKLCIISNILIGHDSVAKIVIGEPVFSNKPE